MTERVTVTVSGLTGSGKSFIYTEIVLALQAIGVPVEHADEKAWQIDIQTSGGEFDRELYRPTVTMAEKNISRKGRARQMRKADIRAAFNRAEGGK